MTWLPQPLVAADFTPDMPELNNPGSDVVLNCLPRTPGSYGPMPSLATFGGALTARCQGAVGVADNSGNTYTFSGDVNDLYEYTAASLSPSVVSKSTHAYTTDPEGQWDMVAFGQRVVATNYADPIQSFLLGSSTKFSDLANGNVLTLVIATPGTLYTNGTNYALTATGGGGTGFAGLVDVVGGVFTNPRVTTPGTGYTSAPTIVLPAGAGGGSGTASITATIQTTIAPKAKYMDIAKGFLIVGNTFDASGGTQTQRVWWCALNDPTNWPTPGTAAAAIVQSSYNDLFDAKAGVVTGIVGNLGGCDVAVFMEHQVWRGIYAGPPIVFDWLPAEGVRGTKAPNSLIHLGLNVYYLGEDGFYVFDGTSSKPIGANRVDKTFFGFLNANYMDRIWGAADPANKVVYWLFPSINAINGVPDTILSYNWNIDKWSVSSVTAEILFRALSFGYTLDTMPGPLDSLTSPLDAAIWTGGNSVMAGFDSSHKLSYLNGPNLAPLIETTESALFDPQITFISDTRPLVDGGIPSVSMATRNRLIDTPLYGPASVINSIGTCPLTANGRYVRARFSLPEATSWTHFQGVEIDATPNGES